MKHPIPFSRAAWRTVAVASFACLLSSPSSAGIQTTEETYENNKAVLRQAEDFHAWVEAEAGKSTFCKRYIGKAVQSTSFEMIAQIFSNVTAKSEFETVDRYNARRAAAAAKAPTGPIVIALPTDREFIHYDAEDKLMNVSAGAFSKGQVSDETQAQLAFDFAQVRLGSQGSAVPYSESVRVTSTRTVQTGLGIPIKVSEADRLTRALYVDKQSLFSFAVDSNSTVLGFEVAAAQAARLKQTMRVAVVAQLKPPYLIEGSLPGVAATARMPVHYTEQLQLIEITPLCGLAIDGQSRVLAAIDAK